MNVWSENFIHLAQLEVTEFIKHGYLEFFVSVGVENFKPQVHKFVDLLGILDNVFIEVVVLIIFKRSCVVIFLNAILVVGIKHHVIVIQSVSSNHI